MNASDLKYIRYESIDSTNSEARRLLQNDAIAPPAVITANTQTAGRGRSGRSFYSPADTGIYMSIITELPENQNDLQLLTVRVSLAVSDAIYDATGIMTGIKWVNDLYIDNKKVCGILTEAVHYGKNSKNAAIIGIGINLNTMNFPAQLADKAGSLSGSGPLPPDCYESITGLIAEYVISMHEMYPDIKMLMDNYRKRSIVIGRKISYEKGGVLIEGAAAGIDETGALIVRLDDGIDYLQSGEISLKSWL